MAVPAYDPKELTVVGEIPPRFGIGLPIPIYSYPVTPKEAFKAMVQRQPVWQISGIESKIFAPKLLPDNVARAMVIQEEPFDNLNDGGGKDMFGLEWEYIAQVGGSMIRPGKPFLEDANEWYDKVVWPDIEKWDWENSAKNNNGTFLGTDTYNTCWLQTGFFERLISFMDFEGAIMAMADEDQNGAVKDLFDKLADQYIKIFDKFITYFPNIDGFCVHDDWGSQKETFFSPALVEEMIVPAMQKVTNFIHSKGKGAELHSCGQILKQVPNMIKAGWDYWGGQAMNDTHTIYDLYGDGITIGVIPDSFDPETTSEEDQRAAARAYADKFCDPKKPSFLNAYGAMLTPAYREELYVRSRQNYSK
ncbi:MAG: methyltransferase [Oscillospiraceae bacterium]|nr:methyltransferase [Oscillospiraceae bacterium]